MRRHLLTLIAMLFAIVTAFSQGRLVKGKVTDEQGNPVPFASIKIKGTSRGTSATAEGTFSITASPSDVFEISAVGYTAITAKADATDATFRMTKASNQELSEVVVTGAYNTKRTSRSTSFNAQVVNQEQLNTIRQTNLNNALAGKVSGVQIRSQSVGSLGRNTAIRLRGDGGLGQGEGAVYVVDGTILPNPDDINLDDFEDVTVLQGPAAAAQFGPQAAAGAIVINTKKAKRVTKGLGVDMNLGTQFDKVYILPNYQNSYAGGNSENLIKYTWQAGHPVEWKALDGKYYHNYSDDASWGPRMVGQEYIPWYSWYGGHSRSYTTTALVPQKDNARDYFNTAINTNNSISITKMTDKVNLRASFGDIYTKGLVPTTSLKKNTFNLNTTIDLDDRLQVGFNINYVATRVNGDIANNDTYSSQSTGSFNQWFHRNLDMGIMKELKGLRTPQGIYASWNHADPSSYDPTNPRAFYAGNYWYNFYTWYDLTSVVNQSQRLFGDISLSYKINNDLRIKATYRKQQNTNWNETKFNSELNESGLQTTGNEPRARGFYSTNNSFSNRRNIEFMAFYTKKIKDFQINANAGMDIFRALAKSNGAQTVDGLNVPNLFTIGNSKSQPTVGNGRSDEKYRAVFLRSDVGYKNFLFMDFSLRNDWFSTLPTAKNNVFSKSFGTAFVFSDLVKIPGISFGKLRASWGEIPQSLGTGLNFGAYLYPGFNYGVGANQWNGNFLMTTPNQLVDSAISGAVKQQKEIGIELRFLNNRLGLQVTYWDGTEKNFPVSIAVNGASGFASKLINTGKITKKGIDVQLNAKVLNLKDLRWDVNATWGRLLENKVVSIAPGVSRISISTLWGTVGPYMVHEEGKQWGMMFGNGIKRINGQPVIDNSGLYVNDPNVAHGSVLPKFTGGLQNTFSFLKNFTANINIDYQVGGKFFSLSDMWGSYSGLTARTAVLNDRGVPIRVPVADGGGVRVTGVDIDGKPKEVYVEAQNYFHGLYDRRAMDFFVYDLTFVKLRELSIGYNIPVNKIGNLSKWINRANFSLVARNPILIYAKTKDFDPSEISTLSGEAAQLPGTRGFGFNLRVSF
mgnify:CR=1 FL=1